MRGRDFLGANPLFGVFLHWLGGLASASFYVPYRQVRGWSWETYWLLQAAACWLVLPWVVAWATTPELGAVLAEAPHGAMLRSYLLGAVYGIGGIAFGVAIG